MENVTGRSGAFDTLHTHLEAQPRTWLVTGCAGFIGSHLVETLLSLGQKVIGIDNFLTGRKEALADALSKPASQKGQFTFLEADLSYRTVCDRAVEGVDFILHQAALGSVPRSIEKPMDSHQNNVDAFLNLLDSARVGGIEKMVFASSSAVYGDSPHLPKVESEIGRPLSPYAATKAINEVYADVYARSYQMSLVGLRYFNVFGPRQDPNGAYAAVIPKWFQAALAGEPLRINGDGQTSRDFCYVKNVVQANLLAAAGKKAEPGFQAYNVAVGGRVTLNELAAQIVAKVSTSRGSGQPAQIIHQAFRAGDIPHSQADISKIQRDLGYSPTHDFARGLDETAIWYAQQNTR